MAPTRHKDCRQVIRANKSKLPRRQNSSRSIETTTTTLSLFQVLIMRLAFRPLALLLSTTTTATSALHQLQRPSTAFFVGHHFRDSFSRRMMSSNSASGSASTSEESNKVRVALCQFSVTSNKEANHKTAADYIDRAAKQGAQLVVFPEIWNSPYATSAFPEYAEILPNVGDDQCPADNSSSSQLLMDLAKQYGIFIIGGSIPESDDGKVYNTCLVYDPTGKVVAKHRKVHLFDIDVPGGITFKESDTLTAGNSLTTFPFHKDLDIGVGICYDIRFALPAMLMCQMNPKCKLLVYPGAFNMTTGPAHWEILQRGRALDNQCFVLTVSPARTEPPTEEGKYPHYTAWGHSTIVSPWGDIIAKADEKESLVVCDLDLDRVDEVRTSIPIRQQKRDDLYQLTDFSSETL